VRHGEHRNLTTKVHIDLYSKAISTTSSEVSHGHQTQELNFMS
jgi:hypothetical protein